ncbi:MAG: 8-oxo-dGTP diphosphatase [Lachnospiraceae bacterium]|nr:8-oxo-dGTP diphosphatase [Lachnospiraceae bacterium]
MTITTLCYIEQNERYLMLHRTKKKNDINEGKWIAIGGHCENGESPEECAKREVREETGLKVGSLRFRGIVTFFSKPDYTEYMCIFTTKEFEGCLHDCNEGDLMWVEKDRINSLNVWEGDRIFNRLIMKDDQPFFSLKLTYDKDKLTEAVLDDKDII